MPRRTIQPIPRSLVSNRDPTFRRQNALFDQGVWDRLDQVQILGDDDSVGHQGCVNALSWSDDGQTLLSGSDDRRICIWGPDTSSTSSTSYSPHPLRLVETISTGHRANIFSAKYLPNTSTPTIVTCAGDREVRVFDVERLSRMDTQQGRGDLDGRHGPGVRVLRCHQDRTKRIATENSPFLFLTVSEDGTVRQHDLRRPHQCRSECPEPLFHAPRGVDLYSLSVSTVTPHIFAVAGRTDCAFICDRRMPEHQTPSWGSHTKASGQVHCVRRLGLPEHEWKTVETTPEGRTIRQDRHITSVKMSSDKADEVICAFARHSTALFSIHDDTTTSSARQTSTSPILSTGNLKPKSNPGELGRSAADFLRSPSSQPPSALPSIAEAGPSRLAAQVLGSASSSPGKRRNSRSPSPSSGPSRTTRPRLEEQEFGSVLAKEEDDRREMRIELEDEDDKAADELDRIMRGMNGSTSSMSGDVAHMPIEAGPSRPQHRSARFGLPFRRRPQLWDRLAADDIDGEDDDMDMEHDDGDEVDDDDIDEDDMEDDDVMFDDEDDFDDEEEEEEDEEYGGCPLSGAGEYGGVEMIHPRMYYKGARNVQTVKDCNFLGAQSDKVVSGSDDGNFFVWDKATGHLDGIWEGDGDVVNVMEQHPTLPLIAVSGIDNTVKIFGPPTKSLSPARSKNRTSMSDTILRQNSASATLMPRGLGSAGIMQLLASRGLVLRDEEGEEGDVPPGCATQ